MTDVVPYLAWFVLGLALGGGYLFLVHMSVRALTAPGKRILPLGPILLRLATAAATFYFAAQSSALSVLATLAGFLLMRSVTLRFFREA